MSRTPIELPCKLTWGSDPRIELTGKAVEISIDSIKLELGERDCRLWPPIGRRITVEVSWFPHELDAHEKRLTCRGSVASAMEAADGTLLLDCAVRKGRFVDVRRSNAQNTRPAANWMM
jgi:hypothetical protein